MFLQFLATIFSSDCEIVGRLFPNRVNNKCPIIMIVVNRTVTYMLSNDILNTGNNYISFILHPLPSEFHIAINKYQPNSSKF